MEEAIINAIDKELLKSELTPEKRLRITNKSHNEIYVITAHNAPNVMKEIGRLREIAFRRLVVAQEKAWISTNSTPAPTAINSLLCGIQKLKRL